MEKRHANATTCKHCRRVIVRAVLEHGRRKTDVAEEFGISVRTVHKWIRRFAMMGSAGLSDKSSRPNHIPRQYAKPDEVLQKAVLELLHSPPGNSGYSRTTWRLRDIKECLEKRGILASLSNISEALRRAGYVWKKARVVLTSTDPEYQPKVQAIKTILANLEDYEVFFSIDEFGPFAIKMRCGRSLQSRGTTRIVPQWQRSKGSVIVTAALELSRNQITHFFSEAKNTEETIRLLELLRREYRGARRMYVSWDAAPWHSSKKLKERVVFLNEWAEQDGAPTISLLPLPSCAQFLNVIESVFSGMARAIVHNSDFDSVDAAQSAISSYFRERNAYFIRHPRRAGNTIWKLERHPSTFSEAGTFKDPKYR